MLYERYTQISFIRLIIQGDQIVHVSSEISNFIVHFIYSSFRGKRLGAAYAEFADIK